MYRCDMGYEVKEDLILPERCHCYDIVVTYKNCKDCRNYNKEYDLIERAIESALGHSFKYFQKTKIK